MAEAEAESPHLEIILPPGLLGLKEEARRNVVEILEKPESRSSDSSFTEALRFYTGRVQLDPEPKWSESLCVSTEDRPTLQHASGPTDVQHSLIIQYVVLSKKMKATSQ